MNMTTNFGKTKPLGLFSVGLFERQGMTEKSVHNPEIENYYTTRNWMYLHSNSDQGSVQFRFQKSVNFEDVTLNMFWLKKKKILWVCRTSESFMLLRSSIQKYHPDDSSLFTTLVFIFINMTLLQPTNSHWKLKMNQSLKKSEIFNH
jgi:hypothetical protein